jgi:hypothetical protein
LIYNKATIGFRNNKRTITFTKTNKPLKKFNIGYFCGLAERFENKEKNQIVIF